MASETTLTTLLPSSPFLLAYSLPLLFASLILTFAGAFLTLDRTRSFAPRYDAIPGAFDISGTGTGKKKFKWLLEGGFGGLLLGYAFGLHLSTFLSLLVPVVSNSSTPLSSKAFVAVWLLPSLVTTFLAGRWKYAALTMGGITGGALFGLSIAVIIHPSLLVRIVLTSIITTLLTLLTLLPNPFRLDTQHPSLRFAASSTGAFGIVVAIALLGNIPAWADVWERFWRETESATVVWGTGKEKGLSAAFCLLLVAGMVGDWYLNKRFGECPDEKWDSYLADYTANLPNLPNRAGTFQPFTSAWDRLFHNDHAHSDNPLLSSHSFSGDQAKDKELIVFPDSTSTSNSNSDIKHKHPLSPPGKLRKYDSSASQFSPTSTMVDDPLPLYELKGVGGGGGGQGFLKKSRSKEARFNARLSNDAANGKGKGGRKSREAVKFRPLSESDEDDSDEDGAGPGNGIGAAPKYEVKLPTSTTERNGNGNGLRPWLRTMSSVASNASTTPTLVGDLPPSPKPKPNKITKSTSTKLKLVNARDDEEEEKEVVEIDYEKEIAQLKAIKRRRDGGAGGSGTGTGSGSGSGGLSDGEVPEYSDYEEDDLALALGPTSPLREKSNHSNSNSKQEWSPGFLKRHRSSASSLGSGSGSGSGSSQRTVVPSQSQSQSLSASANANAPFGALPVPATPSLIKALDRVAAAQRDAFGNGNGSGGGAPSTPAADYFGGAGVGSPRNPGIQRLNTGLPPVSEDSPLGTLARTNINANATANVNMDTDRDTRIVSPTPVSPEGRGQKWETFWKEVRDKSLSERERGRR